MKKLVIPLIIIIIVLLYSLTIALPVTLSDAPLMLKITIGLGEILLIYGLIKVYIERINEIKEEDKDDLGKY